MFRENALPQEIEQLRIYAESIGKNADWIAGVVAALACVPTPRSAWPEELGAGDEATRIVAAAMEVMVLRGDEEDTVSVPVFGSQLLLGNFCRGWMRGLRAVPGGVRLARFCEPIREIASDRWPLHAAPDEVLGFVLVSVQLVLQAAKKGPPRTRTNAERNRAKRGRKAG